MTNSPLKPKLAARLKPYYELFKNAEDFKIKHEQWMSGYVGNINPEEVEDVANGVWRTLYKLEKGFDDSPAARAIANAVKLEVDEFKVHIPLITALCNKGLRERHWDQMSEIVSFQLKPEADTCLSQFLDMNLESHLEAFEAISEGASKEFSLEKTLTKMKQDWEEIEFGVKPHGDSGTFIFSSMDEIQMLLDDQIVKTQTMLGSPYVKFLEVEIYM